MRADAVSTGRLKEVRFELAIAYNAYFAGARGAFDRVVELESRLLTILSQKRRAS